MDEIFTSITVATVNSARKRVIAELSKLTNGKTQKAIELVEELQEWDSIIDKMNQE